MATQRSREAWISQCSMRERANAEPHSTLRSRWSSMASAPTARGSTRATGPPQARARSGRIVEREPLFAIVGDQVAMTRDEKARRLYGLIAPSDPEATGPRSADLVSWDLRTGKEL